MAAGASVNDENLIGNFAMHVIGQWRSFAYQIIRTHFPNTFKRFLSMKILLIFPAVALVSGASFQAPTTMATNKTTTQPYTVMLAEKDFEIRFYPASTMAKIKSSANSYKELGNTGFRKLAGYIFGGNETSQQIPMTAPVHMDVGDTVSSMSFVMPPGYNAANLPKPKDTSVAIVAVEEEYVAAITFGGYASDSKIADRIEQLRHALDAVSIVHTGRFRYLGYNAPYQFFGRRNEIIVQVIWTGVPHS